MTDTIDRSDLLDWAHHEHEHLTKLFDDLRATFNKIAVGELEGTQREEALDQAVDDLEGALDDMLEHFNEEEEVYFLAIEARFPEFSEQIENLISTHEKLCSRTQRLQRLLATREDDLSEMSGELIALINELTLSLERHNEEEQEVFVQALKRLPEDERIALLDAKKTLG
jgi:hemerythrin-like domain-containing protein